MPSEQSVARSNSEKENSATSQVRKEKIQNVRAGGSEINASTNKDDHVNCNNQPSSSLHEINKNVKDGVFIARDEISFYSGMISILAWFFSVIAIVFGAIVGVNVFQGKTILEDARKELSELRSEKSKTQEAKQKYDEGVENLSDIADKIFNETVSKIKFESLSILEELVKKEFGVSTAARYKNELLVELEKDNPDDNYVYVRLTDIINYPDVNSFKIFSECATKLSYSRDVMHIVSKGLQIAAEKAL
jgi:hypothetical protein